MAEEGPQAGELTEATELTENANANGNAPYDTVTVNVPLTEAARQLGISLPRLIRLLKRPELAPGVSLAQRETKTGTRTVTLVSVSVLEAVRFVISEHKHKQYGPNRYRSEEAASDGSLQATDGPLPALALMVMAEREARLADKDAEIQRLTRTLAEMQEALRMAQENLSREQALRMLPAPMREIAGTTPEHTPRPKPVGSFEKFLNWIQNK